MSNTIHFACLLVHVSYTGTHPTLHAQALLPLLHMAPTENLLACLPVHTSFRGASPGQLCVQILTPVFYQTTTEKNPTSQLSSLFSGIHEESTHCRPYHVHRNPLQVHSVAQISTGPERESSHTPTARNSFSFSTATLSQSSSSGILRSSCRLTLSI